MKKIITIICFLVSSTLFSQNEYSQWYFGNHAGLNFMTSPPTVLSNSASNSLYGCSTIADINGNLLFYTDGMNVYDQTHNIMANGTGLGMTTNTSLLIYQYSLIVKQPGASNIYFIFTNCSNTGTYGLFYSTVDMSLAAGMGSVTIKNTVVSTVQPSGQLAIAQHCNGKDFWVINHDYGNTNSRSFLISSTGVSINPVISTVGVSATISSYLKISRNGKKAASVYNSSYLTVYDFDASSGVISNSLALTTGSNGAYFDAMEFSPDGSKLYSTVNTFPQRRIVQYDLCAGSSTVIIASQYTTTAGTTPNYGMQLAPDGKIYVAMFSQNALGVINNPNASGAACNYIHGGLSLNTGTCMSSLPNFASKPLPSPTFSYNVVCQTANYTNTAASNTVITNCAMATPSLVSWLWNFGDPLSGTSNTSTLTNPSHFYSGIGTYTTQLILNYPCFQDTITQVIHITVPSPVYAISGPSVICLGNTATLSASPTSGNTYSWSTGANSNSISVSPTLTTSYTITAFTSTSSCQRQSVITLTVNKCSGIESLKSLAEQLKVYPNPTNHSFNLKYGFLNDLSKIEMESIKMNITNQLGQLVYSRAIQSENEEIDVSTWAKGVYFLKVQSTEIRISKKLFVE